MKDISKEQAEQEWAKTVESLKDEKKDTHITKEFTFSVTELRKLVKLVTIETLIKQSIQNVIDYDVLKRLGLDQVEDVYVYYSLGLGRFIAKIPKEIKKKKT